MQVIDSFFFSFLEIKYFLKTPWEKNSQTLYLLEGNATKNGGEKKKKKEVFFSSLLANMYEKGFCPSNPQP